MKCTLEGCENYFIPKTKRGKYCSKTCLDKSYNIKRRKKLKFTNCLNCDKPLPSDRHPNKSVCNSVCQSALVVKRKHVAKVKKVCKFCKNEFTTSYKVKVFCDDKCRYEQKLLDGKLNRQNTEIVKSFCGQNGCCNLLISRQRKRCEIHKGYWKVASERLERCLECDKELEPNRIKFCTTSCNTKHTNRNRCKLEKKLRKEKKPYEIKVPKPRAKKKKVMEDIKPVIAKKKSFKSCECGILFKGDADEIKCMPCRMGSTKTKKDEVE